MRCVIYVRLFVIRRLYREQLLRYHGIKVHIRE